MFSSYKTIYLCMRCRFHTFGHLFYISWQVYIICLYYYHYNIMIYIYSISILLILSHIRMLLCYLMYNVYNILPHKLISYLFIINFIFKNCIINKTVLLSINCNIQYTSRRCRKIRSIHQKKQIIYKYT